MKVGFFSPLPPARSGVADHAQNLLRHLRKHGSVEIAPSSASVNLYHLGNNQMHAGVYAKALREPGVIVLHDALLHHFLLGSLDETQYVEEFAYNYGAWSGSLARQLWRVRGRSGADPRFFDYAMLKRICETARAVIVHNPEAARTVKSQVPAARTFEVPLLFEAQALASAHQLAALRQSLDIDSEKLLVGVFGHLRETKRVVPLLRVFSRLQDVNAVLLLAGDAGSRDLERAIQIYAGQIPMRRVRHSSKATFGRLSELVDLCVNLRYPSAGETSAIGVNMMGLGKCVLFSDSLAVSRYPDAACVRTSTGLAEERHLEENLRWLHLRPNHRRQIGAYAAEYIAKNHNPDVVAGLYWRILREAQ